MQKEPAVNIQIGDVIIFNGKTGDDDLTKGKEYIVINIDCDGDIRIVDDEDDYTYFSPSFVEQNFLKKTKLPIEQAHEEALKLLADAYIVMYAVPTPSEKMSEVIQRIETFVKTKQIR